MTKVTHVDRLAIEVMTMMKARAKRGFAFAGVVLLSCGVFVEAASAKLSEEERASLGITGTPLTPLGAIRAGNEAGTIPAWEGGLSTPPAGYPASDPWPYIDPYAADTPLYRISAQNYKQYEEILPVSYVEMFKHYPDTFWMDVYPSHRSAAYPTFVYENTIRHSSNFSQCGGGGTSTCVEGRPEDGGALPFPIPHSGEEIILNTAYRYLGLTMEWKSTALVVSPEGAYDTSVGWEWFAWPYWMPKEQKPNLAYITKEGGSLFCLMRLYESPPRLSGQRLGGCKPFDTMDTDAYLYLPGQRRVRRAPEIGLYDSPLTGSDGLATSDVRWGYAVSKTNDWFVWENKGRQEKLIAYNPYKLLASTAKGFDEFVRPAHANPSLIRYELHRVWTLEGKLDKGYRHISPSRTMYVDEDTWIPVSALLYDSTGGPMRVMDVFNMTFYDQPTVHPVGDVHYDFASKRWVTYPYYPRAAPVWNKPQDWNAFTPSGLRAQGFK